MNFLKKYFWLWLSLILIIGAGLRLYHLGSMPDGLYWDEVAMLVDAQVVAETGRDMHGLPGTQLLFPSYGDYKQPVYIWLATLSVKLFGASEWALRLPSAVAGILTIWAAGYLARRLFEQHNLPHAQLIQLATSLAVAVSPWDILFSRAGFEGHVGQLLVLLAVILLSFQRKQRWLVLTIVVAAGATYTYFSVRFVWPVVFGLYQVLLFLPEENKFWNIRSWLMRVIVPLAVYGALLIPMTQTPFYAASNQFRYNTDSVLNTGEYALQSNVYRELSGNTVLDRALFHRYWLMTQELLANYSDHLSFEFLFVSGDPNLRHGTGQHGLFLLPWLPLLLWGGYVLYHQHKPLLLFLLGWWLIALLPASVPENTPHALRSLNALAPLSILLGSGLLGLVTIAFDKKHTIFKKALLGTWLVWLSLTLIGFVHFYFTVYPTLAGRAWLSGYKEVTELFVTADPSIKKLYWEVGDDKFFLWLLAYGRYTPEQIQAFESRQFLLDESQLERFKRKYFAGWEIPEAGESVLQVGDRVLVATERVREAEIRALPDTKVLNRVELGVHQDIIVLELEHVAE